jgi:hypothetical protein
VAFHDFSLMMSLTIAKLHCTVQTCAVLNFEEQRIEYYDSLGGVDRLTIDSLLQWVEDEYADKYKKPLPERFQVRPSSAFDSSLQATKAEYSMPSHAL